MECWFWNIYLESQSYFWSEMKEGRLRQGWGYGENLDLRKLYEKIDNKLILDEKEQQAWDRCQHMLVYIKQGDLIAVKNVPTREQFAIARVIGPYDFKIGDNGDFGHILPIQIVNTFHKYSKVVPSSFVNALNRERNPIRITYKHSQTMRELAGILPTDENKDKPQEFKEKIRDVRSNLIKQLRELLRQKLTFWDAEQLILEMVRREREGEDVRYTAGSGERGADGLWFAQVGYGLAPFKIGIQVKKHWGEDNDTTGIDQLEKAFQAHSLQAGLLVSLADKLGQNLLSRIEEAKKKYNIHVLYGNDLYELLLELIVGPDINSENMPENPQA